MIRRVGRRDAVLTLLLLLCLQSCTASAANMSMPERRALRARVRSFFYHAFRNYKEHAYPLDELKPLTCEGRRWDRRERGTLDDTLGGFATTMVDSLGTMVVLGDVPLFRQSVLEVVRDVHFDRDVIVSVFETTIRVLGGLLSAHLLAAELDRTGEWYRGAPLLHKAEQLAVRLMPAFDTPTGIPAHRVHLQRGLRLNPGASPSSTAETVTCPAAAGTLLLEFGMLSRLTGNATYERAAHRATLALWQRRSPLNLVGATIDTHSGAWRETHSGIGAGIDSFYEYLLKSHVVLGNEEYLNMFQSAYAATALHMRQERDDTGLTWHVEVDMRQGAKSVHSRYISSLSAFWPGLQVLAGDTVAATHSFAAFWSLWQRFGALPEMFNLNGNSVVPYAKDWPLRPELAESAYHLFRATRDPFYLRAGEAIVETLEKVTRVPCGFAAIADVRGLRLDDRMDSYFLSETLKYLFLLFSEGHALDAACEIADGNHSSSICSGDENMLFTTEGHIILLDALWRRSADGGGKAAATAAERANACEQDGRHVYSGRPPACQWAYRVPGNRAEASANRHRHHGVGHYGTKAK